jgi:hypothetical protein
MSKLMTAIMAAALIAAAMTVFSARAAHVDASPRPLAEVAQMRSCTERPLALPALRRHALRQFAHPAGEHDRLAANSDVGS